ncbi:exodeoxyribonuclease VII large subunit [Lacticaseibacillus jixianensis]|uniref:Exodeoxyribonuclease 7 large subunit n=1 Tax=Lacticaseibacillus jixianensis TaxID=2486012 RepID=A0ABW4B9E3_9LACO|nr:exodeoxyribonuclease VII large subunit [Lacticaseibacillus jixianensis]
MAEPEYLTVSLLTEYLRRKFDLDPYLSKVYLAGEITNFRKRPGHQYFSLKDEHAKINVVMFKSAFARLKFEPKEGDKVHVTGRVTLYPASGQYQIVIEQMAPEGVGELYLAYEQLKAKLAAEGLFAKNQRPLRQFPKRVAVITSPSGAVIQDIMTTVARRYPILQIVLFPAQVQGDQAAATIVTQLRRVKAMGDFDALIIGRGGGSIEDLWPFNEESVARALADMPMPIVSSVGHETDTTITDFVADQRAATPTAAAELVTPVPLTDGITRIQEDQLRIRQAMITRIQAAQDRLARATNSVVLTQPTRLYDQYLQQVDQLTTRLQGAAQTQIIALHQRVKLAQTSLNPRQLAVRLANTQQTVANDLRRLQRAAAAVVAAKRQAFTLANEALDHLGPDQILGRGYSYVTGPRGKALTRVKDFTPGAKALIHVEDGIVPVVVEERKHSNGGSK